MDAGHLGESGRYDSLKETAQEYAFAVAVVRVRRKLTLLLKWGIVDIRESEISNITGGSDEASLLH